MTGAISGTVLNDVSSTITYSDFGEPNSLAYSHGPTPLYAAIYQRRDALGRIESKLETIGGVSVQEEYIYDAAGRLDRVERDGIEVFDAEYDGNGNRTALQTPSGTRVASHDDQDRLLADGALEFTYTEVGDLRTRTDTSTNQVTTYEYDELGALIEIELPGGTEIAYTVDGAGRRIGKSVNGALQRGWLYGAQIGPIAELDASGAIRSRFVYGTRAHVPDYMERGGETFRLVTDHLGSVRLVVNADTGAIAQRIDYDPWGVVTQDTNHGFQPFGYAGGLYDPDTGLVRFGARDYDARTGRWTAKDPIGFRGGDTNLYAYVGGNPVNVGDSLGTQPGSPEWCWAKAQKILNLLKSIGRRIGELREDPSGGTMPEACTGDDLEPGLSRRGHRRLINMDKANLAWQQILYWFYCSGGVPPDPVPEPEPALEDNGSPFSLKQWEENTGLRGVALIRT